MAKCETCRSKNEIESVPYIVHESAMARAERHAKRLWIALVVAVALMFACNSVWLYAWMQYDYSSEEIIYQQDGEGTNIIGNDNEVDNYGAKDDNSPSQEN